MTREGFSGAFVSQEDKDEEDEEDEESEDEEDEESEEEEDEEEESEEDEADQGSEEDDCSFLIASFCRWFWKKTRICYMTCVRHVLRENVCVCCFLFGLVT